VADPFVTPWGDHNHRFVTSDGPQPTHFQAPTPRRDGPLVTDEFAVSSASKSSTKLLGFTRPTEGETRADSWIRPRRYPSREPA
jgi:hypothetical protein